MAKPRRWMLKRDGLRLYLNCGSPRRPSGVYLLDKESTGRWHIKTDVPGSIDFAGMVICLRAAGARGDFTVPEVEEKKPAQSD